jgi:hypothetical protein
MSTSFSFSLAGLLQWVGPIIGFAWAQRSGRSRAYILLASALGGTLAGAVAAIPIVRMSVQMGDEPNGLSYLLFHLLLTSTLAGAVIGIVGLVVRAIEARGKRA